MHRVILLLVDATSEEEAVEAAQEKFEERLRFCSDDRLDGARYDYCKPMAAGHSVAGSDRWTDFADEPAAYPLDSGLAETRLKEFIGYTRRHFAEGVYGLLSNMMDKVEERGGDPQHVVDMVQTVHDTYEEKNWSSGADVLDDEYPDTLMLMREAGYARHFADRIGGGVADEAHIFDIRENSWYTTVYEESDIEYLEELIDDPPEDAWVVPLDVHS